MLNICVIYEVDGAHSVRKQVKHPQGHEPTIEIVALVVRTKTAAQVGFV